MSSQYDRANNDEELEGMVWALPVPWSEHGTHPLPITGSGVR
jgi:hypothetical protein